MWEFLLLAYVLVLAFREFLSFRKLRQQQSTLCSQSKFTQLEQPVPIQSLPSSSPSAGSLSSSRAPLMSQEVLSPSSRSNSPANPPPNGRRTTRATSSRKPRLQAIRRRKLHPATSEFRSLDIQSKLATKSISTDSSPGQFPLPLPISTSGLYEPGTLGGRHESAPQEVQAGRVQSGLKDDDDQRRLALQESPWEPAKENSLKDEEKVSQSVG